MMDISSDKSGIISCNPFNSVLRDFPPYGKYYSLTELNDCRIAKLPYSIRVLLESAVRCCDEFEVKKIDVEHILNWRVTSQSSTEIPFKPSRVILQDFTGVPAAVDFAAMRDAICRLGGDASRINPLVPVDLVIDHSVQVDFSRDEFALEKNQEIEFERNYERFAFLKWAAAALSNMLIVPPGSGIVHQVNLEYLARVVFKHKGLLYPDSVVGTDSHTTMIDGLGVVGWGVGGIEAEAVMLGQPISMVLPEVVGFKLEGVLPMASTATDLVLTVTKMLRAKGVVGKFVEFYGDGCKNLTLADRATIGNMSPEYGATMGFFPVDEQTMSYLRQSGRPDDTVHMVREYLIRQGLFRQYTEADQEIEYTEVMFLDLSTVRPSCSGPKRPHDQVLLSNMAKDFKTCLTNKIGFKGFGLAAEKVASDFGEFEYKKQKYSLTHGSVVIAAITSCTNTSNPSVMIGAGLLAKNAIAAGLNVLPYIKTSLSPGSEVVYKYLESSGLLKCLEHIGFFTTGFGCQTCIGNSGDLDPEVATVITTLDLVGVAALSGNRNFEGRVHPLTRANYLMSPMLVVAYALASRIDIDFETEPIGKSALNGEDVYLKEIWPSTDTIRDLENMHVRPDVFRSVYTNIAEGGSQSWRNLKISKSSLFEWSPKSTYIHNPPFFQTMEREVQPVRDIQDAFCLLSVGDSITTDHISPAGAIAKSSPAAKFLERAGVAPFDFNSYGSRRGNDQIMARGTFANIRLINKLSSKNGPFTVHMPSKEQMTIFDAAQLYLKDNKDLIVLAGKEYGSGSSRDWAAKGPFLLGVKAVIAQSFERIHRSNLVGMGILPLQFMGDDNAESLGLTGTENFSICLTKSPMSARQPVEVHVKSADGVAKSFRTVSRIDTDVELEYFKNGGILPYVLRKLL